MPQSMPGVVEATLPLPVPARAMVSAFPSEPKLAVTVLSPVIATVHVPVPEQVPSQPANVEPVSGVIEAVSVTLVPLATVTVQSDGQFSPPPVTLPAPTPDLATVRV